MPHAPFVHWWRVWTAVLLLAVAIATPALAQGPRNEVIYILMGDNYFLPASVTVQTPITVVFINQGQTIHSVRSALWDSGPMMPGQAFWREFTVPGEYWFTDPQYTDAAMSGYVTIQFGAPVATRTPQRPPPPTAPPAAPPGAAPAPGAAPPAPAAGATTSPLVGPTPTTGAAPAGATPRPATTPGTGPAPGGAATPAPAGTPGAGGGGAGEAGAAGGAATSGGVGTGAGGTGGTGGGGAGGAGGADGGMGGP
jgi:plastocyanin